MNGFMNKTMKVLCVAGGLAGVGGCLGYRDVVDPCYPDRYEFMARREVIEAVTPQVRNGHALDQTVWNYHFEFDEATQAPTRLTCGAREHLAYLARHRPCPDATIVVQTAQDIPYDPMFPEKFPELRSRLDSLRVAEVQKFLNAYTAGQVAFNVSVDDVPEVGMAAARMRGSIIGWYGASQGVMGLASGTGSPPQGPTTAQTTNQTTSNITQTNVPPGSEGGTTTAPGATPSTTGAAPGTAPAGGPPSPVAGPAGTP